MNSGATLPPRNIPSISQNIDTILDIWNNWYKNQKGNVWDDYGIFINVLNT